MKRSLLQNSRYFRTSGQRSFSSILTVEKGTEGACEVGPQSDGAPAFQAKNPIVENLVNNPHFSATLKNGFQVCTEPKQGETAAIGVMIGAGSRQESALNNGVAHFLEHMYFKGTQRRTDRDLELEFENNGASLNAHTSREYTIFTSNCLANDVERSVDALADMLLNSKFDPQMIEAEKQTIQREYEDVNQSIQEVLFDKLHELAFDGHSLAFPILGSEENIATMTQQQMVDFRRDQYLGGSMALVSSGNVDPQQMKELAEKYFGDVPFGSPVCETPQATVPFTGGDIRLDNEDIPNIHIACGFHGPGLKDQDLLVLNLMQILIGSYDKGMGAGKYASSPVIRSIASQGVARAVQPFNHAYTDTGLFGFYTIGDPNTCGELLYTLMGGMTKMCFNIREEQLERAKRVLISEVLHNYSGPLGDSLEDMGRQVLFLGHRQSPTEIVGKIENITAQDIYRVTDQYVYDQDPVIAAVGKDTHLLPDYNWSRSWTSFWRA